MIIIPAIDLMGGKVVRLSQGKKELAKAYSSNPLDVAKDLRDSGAEIIHVVDLDAAFNQGDNLSIIEDIMALDVSVQIGGGIRSLAKAAQLVTLGAQRIVVGTKALEREFLEHMLIEFYYHVAISVDVKDDKVMTSGWQKESEVKFIDFVEHLAKNQVRWIVYTDISRDGMLGGANFDSAKKLADFTKVNFILSGGVGSLDDIKKIKDEIPFIHGIIIGKALYENKFKLIDAIKILA